MRNDAGCDAAGRSYEPNSGTGAASMTAAGHMHVHQHPTSHSAQTNNIHSEEDGGMYNHRDYAAYSCKASGAAGALHHPSVSSAPSTFVPPMPRNEASSAQVTTAHPNSSVSGGVLHPISNSSLTGMYSSKAVESRHVVAKFRVDAPFKGKQMLRPITYFPIYTEVLVDNDANFTLPDVPANSPHLRAIYTGIRRNDWTRGNCAMVERRYSEVCDLRELLVYQFPTLILPPLMPKNSVTDMETFFNTVGAIAMQRNNLQFFLREIAAMPAVMFFSEWTTPFFLDPRDSFETGTLIRMRAALRTYRTITSNFHEHSERHRNFAEDTASKIASTSTRLVRSVASLFWRNSQTSAAPAHAQGAAFHPHSSNQYAAGYGAQPPASATAAAVPSMPPASAAASTHYSQSTEYPSIHPQQQQQQQQPLSVSSSSSSPPAAGNYTPYLATSASAMTTAPTTSLSSTTPPTHMTAPTTAATYLASNPPLHTGASGSAFNFVALPPHLREHTDMWQQISKQLLTRQKTLKKAAYAFENLLLALSAQNKSQSKLSASLESYEISLREAECFIQLGEHYHHAVLALDDMAAKEREYFDDKHVNVGLRLSFESNLISSALDAIDHVLCLFQHLASSHVYDARDELYRDSCDYAEAVSRGLQTDFVGRYRPLYVQRMRNLIKKQVVKFFADMSTSVADIVSSSSFHKLISGGQLSTDKNNS